MEQIRAYFNRLGLPEDLEVTKTYEFLKALQYAHVTTVPYENLDILRGKALSMKWDDLYDKIVTRHMGGYCFELNGALSYLLKSLGFEVENYFGQQADPCRGFLGKDRGRCLYVRHGHR